MSSVRFSTMLTNSFKRSITSDFCSIIIDSVISWFSPWFTPCLLFRCCNSLQMERCSIGITSSVSIRYCTGYRRRRPQYVDLNTLILHTSRVFFVKRSLEISIGSVSPNSHTLPLRFSKIEPKHCALPPPPPLNIFQIT